MESWKLDEFFKMFVKDLAIYHIHMYIIYWWENSNIDSQPCCIPSINKWILSIIPLHRLPVPRSSPFLGNPILSMVSSLVIIGSWISESTSPHLSLTLKVFSRVAHLLQAAMLVLQNLLTSYTMILVSMFSQTPCGNNINAHHSSAYNTLSSLMLVIRRNTLTQFSYTYWLSILANLPARLAIRT